MTGLVGRDRELGELRSVLRDARGGRPRVVLISGEAGIGKTSLARAIVDDARAAGGAALWATAVADDGAPAFWPWRTLLTTHVQRTEPHALAAQIGQGGAQLCRLVPELRQRLPGLGLLPAPEEGGRYPLFLAVAGLLGAVAGAGPLTVVLDDLPSADTDSLLLFEFLAEEIREGSLLLVATVRSGTGGRSDRLPQAVAELVRRPGARLLPVEGLARPAVRRLVEVVAGRAVPAAAVEAIHRRTEGNPFFVTELVRLLVARGRLDDAALAVGGDATIPPGVEAVVAGRLAALTEPCRMALRTGAVIGRSFPVGLLGDLLDEPESSVLAALDEAVAAGLVREDTGADRFRFAHPLVHEVVAGSLTRARRLRLHRRIAERIESGGTPSLAELAHHWCAAGDDPGRALDYAARAAAEATASGAYAEAALLYERAIALAGDGPARGGL
ncbi:MAG TPA: AAA family ATPase, partial [Actinophytocola sp.]|uniref:ATP-binding protein n=1 Tax=Actinophytocola sp. TaxID=1872138 RepID=UPI002DDD9E19